MKTHKLEDRLTRKFFRDLDRALVCPYQVCRELGEHFRCYSLDFEECDLYIRHEERQPKGI